MRARASCPADLRQRVVVASGAAPWRWLPSALLAALAACDLTAQLLLPALAQPNSPLRLPSSWLHFAEVRTGLSDTDVTKLASGSSLCNQMYAMFYADDLNHDQSWVAAPLVMHLTAPSPVRITRRT